MEVKATTDKPTDKEKVAQALNEFDDISKVEDCETAYSNIFAFIAGMKLGVKIGNQQETA